MKAIAVFPGKPDSVHLAKLPKPSVNPGARGSRRAREGLARRCRYDLIGTNDMTTDDAYFERGINLRHGFLTEHYVAGLDGAS